MDVIFCQYLGLHTRWTGHFMCVLPKFYHLERLDRVQRHHWTSLASHNNSQTKLENYYILIILLQLFWVWLQVCPFLELIILASFWSEVSTVSSIINRVERLSTFWKSGIYNNCMLKSIALWFVYFLEVVRFW